MALDGKQIKQATVPNAKLATASSTASANSVVLSKANSKIDISFIPTDDLINLHPWRTTLFGPGTYTLNVGRINKYSNESGGAMTLHLPASPAEGDVVELKEVGDSSNSVTLTTAAGTTSIENVSNSSDVNSITLNAAKVYLNYKWDSVDATWRLIGMVDRTGGDSLMEDQLTTLATSNDGDPVSASGLAAAPSPFSIILVYLNGVGINHISYGNKTAGLYFSNDNGTTSANRNAVTAGSKLYWNGTVAGFQLQSGWTFKVVYSV